MLGQSVGFSNRLERRLFLLSRYATVADEEQLLSGTVVAACPLF